MDGFPHLGDRQQFVLAFLAVEGEGGASVGREALSNAACREFDGYEQLSYVPRATRHGSRHGPKKKIPDSSASATTRALSTLIDRGYVTPGRVSRTRRTYKWKRLSLTDDGAAVAEEILRRHNDGRYSLAFDTLD